MMNKEIFSALQNFNMRILKHVQFLL